MSSDATPLAPARPHTIVVVGGGAGGLELVTSLGDRFGSGRAARAVRVILVDQSPAHVWKPLLHEVAAGSLDPHTHELSYAAQARWHGFEFQQGELLALDRAARTLTVGPVSGDEGDEMLPRRSIAYDTLVIAIGSVTNFFGTPGAAEHTFALDTADQADRFRRRLIAACVRAETGLSASSPSPRAKIIVSIIGAGATGVELAAELRNTAQVLEAYGVHHINPREDLQIRIIEGGERILPALPERVSSGVHKLLDRAAIEVITGERVVDVAAHQLRTASGRTFPTDLTVWAAGIVAPAVLSRLDGLAQNRMGQLIVRSTLQSENDPDVFALGDCAACPWRGREGTVPPRAQVAHQQASFLVKSLARRVRGEPIGEFQFRDFGSLVSLGRMDAVGSLMGGLIGGSFLVDGWLARIMYVSLYQLHVMALHGAIRMSMDTVGRWLLSKTQPRVKLH